MFCISIVCVFGQKMGSGKERVSVTEENITTTTTTIKAEPKPRVYNNEFHISLVGPTGDAADDDNGVGTGFGAGFTFYKPIRSVKNLSLLWGFDLSFNPTSADFKEDFEDLEDMGVDITYPLYINMPFRFGANYTYPITPVIGVFGEAALGFNLSFITPFKVEVEEYERSVNYTPAAGFFYGAKFGVLFDRKYSLGVNFNHLGTYKYAITEEGYDFDGEEYRREYKSSKMSIGNWMLSLGIRF